MNKRTCIVICYFLMFSYQSCERIKSPVNPVESELLKTINIVDMLPWEDNNFDIDPFTIKNIKICKDTLIIDISYKGGNKNHEFLLYCSTFLYKSYPPQRDLWLSHNSNSDTCYNSTMKTLKFNLKSLKSDDYNSVFLRLYEFGYEYGKSEPIKPLLLYEF